MDGTFKMAPKNFSQLYVICGKLGSSAVTYCYALLPDKDRRKLQGGVYSPT